MKRRFLHNSRRVGMMSALVVAAAMVLSLQGCLAPGRVIVQAPPPVLSAPPYLYVVPGTYVYYVADVDADIFFYQGFWYRFYPGGWYRGNGYNGPWISIVLNRVPLVVRNVPRSYRSLPARSSRLPHIDVHKNWQNWERERYWDRHGGDKDKDKGGDRHDYRDSRRSAPEPQGRPVILQEPRGSEEHPGRENKEYKEKEKDKDKDKDKDHKDGPRHDYRDSRRSAPEPHGRPVILQEPRGQESNEYKNTGRGRDQYDYRGKRAPELRQRPVIRQEQRQDQRQDQKQASEPAHQLKQPKALEGKKEITSRQKQSEKKGKSGEKDDDQDTGPSEDANEKRRDEDGKKKGR